MTKPPMLRPSAFRTNFISLFVIETILIHVIEYPVGLSSIKIHKFLFMKLFIHRVAFPTTGFLSIDC